MSSHSAGATRLRGSATGGALAEQGRRGGPLGQGRSRDATSPGSRPSPASELGRERRRLGRAQGGIAERAPGRRRRGGLAARRRRGAVRSRGRGPGWCRRRSRWWRPARAGAAPRPRPPPGRAPPATSGRCAAPGLFPVQGASRAGMRRGRAAERAGLGGQVARRPATARAGRPLPGRGSRVGTSGTRGASSSSRIPHAAKRQRDGGEREHGRAQRGALGPPGIPSRTSGMGADHGTHAAGPCGSRRRHALVRARD